MAGMLTALMFHNKLNEAARVASDCTCLFAKIADPAFTAEASLAAANAKFQAGEALEALSLAQCAIDIADGDPTKHSLLIGSPLAFALAMRGGARLCLGLPSFLDDLDDAIVMARSVQDTTTYVAAVLCKYGLAVHNGVFLPDVTADQETAEALERAERVGDDFARGAALQTRGIVLANQPGERRAAGLELLARSADPSERQGNSQWSMRFVITETAKERARLGDLEGAIALGRETVEFLFASGDAITRGPAVSVLVESLLRRGTEADIAEAEAAIGRLAAVPTDPGFVLYELPLLRLRALLARTHGDENSYRDYRDRYSAMATSLGFEGHMKWAEAMP